VNIEFLFNTITVEKPPWAPI